MGTRRRPLNNCWVKLNVRSAEKRTGIPFVGLILSRKAVPGIARFVGNARIGVFGFVKVAINVHTGSHYRVNIVDTKLMRRIMN